MMGMDDETVHVPFLLFMGDLEGQGRIEDFSLDFTCRHWLGDWGMVHVWKGRD